jgi:hypothetical protein
VPPTAKAWLRPPTLGTDVDELLAALEAVLGVSAIEDRFSDDLPVITPQRGSGHVSKTRRALARHYEVHDRGSGTRMGAARSSSW